jgi:hypothetical protein
MAPLHTLTLTVPPEWRQAARYAGHRHVKTWLECVVEDFLETGPGRYFPILPLDWHRGAFHAIRTSDDVNYAPHDVRGLVAGPFGIFKGIYRIYADPLYQESFTLTHTPTGRRLAVLDRVRSCKQLAEALAPLRMHWHLADPDRVGGEDVERVNALVREYEQADLPERLRDGAESRQAAVGGRR